jgi:Rrf2 family nitric oxide-sensitive transcriptional repressor
VISTTAEYALRAVVFLAEKDGGRWTTRSIAEATQIPPGYLAKVMQTLAQAGVVNGQRGVNGGFALDRPADEISIYEIIRVIDPLKRIRDCPLKLPEHADKLCPLHSRLDQAVAQIEASFRESSVADLLSRPTFCPATDTKKKKEG